MCVAGTCTLLVRCTLCVARNKLGPQAVHFVCSEAIGIQCIAWLVFWYVSVIIPIPIYTGKQTKNNNNQQSSSDEITGRLRFPLELTSEEYKLKRCFNGFMNALSAS